MCYNREKECHIPFEVRAIVPKIGDMALFFCKKGQNAMATYHKSYKTFRGVDFSSERSACDETRFNYLLNMWRDYHSESGAAIETSPGFRKLLEGDKGKVNGMHFLPGKGDEQAKVIIHCGRDLRSYDIHEVTFGEDSLPVRDEEGRLVKGTSVWIDESTGKYISINPHKWNAMRVADAPSRSLLFHDSLYVVDGTSYFRIKHNENDARSASSDTAYIPTVYLDGEPYEQRNMLTDLFYERFSVAEGETGEAWKTMYLHAPVRAIDGGIVVQHSDGSEEHRYCFEYGWAKESGATYELNDGTRFSEFEVLDTLGIVDFSNAQYQMAVWIGKKTDANGLESDFFYLVRSVAEQGESIDHYYLIKTKEDFKFEYVKTDDESARGYYVTSIGLKGLEKGDKVVIKAYSQTNNFGKVIKDMKDVEKGNQDFTDFTGTALDAINGCTLITEFDGRIFLSGNPKLPNSVFYTQRDLTGYNNPFYIGAYNYLNDGTGSTPITAMMTTPTHLIVLKDDVAQGASIYYHTAQDNPSSDKVTADLQPRIYPRENGVPGLGCLGAACNFRDDPVFISPHGLEAVGKSQVNLERTVVHRSSYVDASLRNEDLRNASMAEWDGYLAILVPGGHMYLADSREMYRHRLGGYEYEWYFWDDIGTWTGTKNRYYYVTSDEEGELEINGVTYTLASQENEGFVPDEIEPCAVKAEDGITRYYVIEGEYAYPCDTSGEQIGGSFREATALLSVDGRLLFGTSDGSICVFNTDRRDENHYIPPEDYTHCGRRYLSGCATKSDSCGRENVTKTTARGSVVLKTKAFPYALITVKVRTNVTAWKEVDKVYGGENDFDHTDFSRFTFNPSAECLSVINEHERKWVEKQFYIFTECWESPFGIVGLAFDYSIAGKVRMR